MTRHRAGVVVLAAAMALAIIVWAIPNMAGRAFVDVRLIATPAGGAAGAQLRQVAIGDAETVPASALNLTIRLEGRYLLPVIVTRSNPPLKVELREDLGGGRAEAIWSVTGSAQELEDGGDSPDGPGGAGLVLVRPGPLDLPIGPLDGVALVDPEGARLAAGDYVLQAWAFDIPSVTVSLRIVDEAR